jgi:hypothetical protein
VTRKKSERALEDSTESDFTDVAKSQTGKSDADLHSADHAAHVAEQFFKQANAGVIGRGHLAQTRMAYGDKRKFGRREKGVNANQKENRE